MQVALVKLRTTFPRIPLSVWFRVRVGPKRNVHILDTWPLFFKLCCLSGAEMDGSRGV